MKKLLAHVLVLMALVGAASCSEAPQKLGTGLSLSGYPTVVADKAAFQGRTLVLENARMPFGLDPDRQIRHMGVVLSESDYEIEAVPLRGASSRLETRAIDDIFLKTSSAQP